MRYRKQQSYYRVNRCDRRETVLETLSNFFKARDHCLPLPFSLAHWCIDPTAPKALDVFDTRVLDKVESYQGTILVKCKTCDEVQHKTDPKRFPPMRVIRMEKTLVKDGHPAGKSNKIPQIIQFCRFEAADA